MVVCAAGLPLCSAVTCQSVLWMGRDNIAAHAETPTWLEEDRWDDVQHRVR